MSNKIINKEMSSNDVEHSMLKEDNMKKVGSGAPGDNWERSN